ncbi:hypothetical protein ABZX12_42710 [Kribbella sp. NPDC003505]|uniref:hypothetical protein n=1 Tax=Kribbella sp. NPDC003505 TaxID=3154448 RepID=UPI0033A8B2C9
MSTPPEEGLGRIYGRNGVLAMIVVMPILAASLAAGPAVIAAVGNLLDHDVTALRVAGFGWGAVPWLIAIPVLAARLTWFRGAGWIWFLWIASGLLLIPLRGTKHLDPIVHADMNQLAFSWLCAISAAVVACMISNVSAMVKGGPRGFAAPALVLGCWVVLFVLGGLAAYFG